MSTTHATAPAPSAPSDRAGDPARPRSVGRPDRAGTVARSNAWFFDTFDAMIDRRIGALKAPLLEQVPATVVEIGAGTGANLRYYPPGTLVVAVEPNPAMHPRLRANAERHGVRVAVVDGAAEAIDLADASADLVVSTLVLCTVERPERVVQEVRRILRPGGRFVVVEHVRASRGGPLRSVQRLVRPVWRRVFDGCDTCRDTEATLRAAGFAHVSLDRHRRFDPLFYPTSELLHGELVR